jgi:hypothetical protein
MGSAVYSLDDAARRLAGLAAWRRGAGAAGVVLLGLVADRALQPIAAVAGLVAAGALCAGAHAARQALLNAWALRDDLAELPEVSRARTRLVAAGRRRELAASLRSTAAQRTVSRHDVAPLLVDRLDAGARLALLAVADDLERAEAVDARTIADITALITDGARSPLLNHAVPAGELDVALRRIHFRLATPGGP